MPHKGDEFHHFGWNACSSALSPMSGHAFVKRRYLVIPGIRSSRLYIVDTHPDPRRPTLAKVIEPEEVFRKTGYSRPHTTHCGPEGIYISTLGGAGADGTQGPAGVFLLDCENFEILGKWEIDRGPQQLHYDFWWNLPRDYMVSSEWGRPPQFENGVVPEQLLANRYGHQLHFWELRGRRHLQTIDLGAQHQMALEVRPAHDPTREYGFLGVVIDTTNLEGSVWTWWREGGKFHARKTATIPPEPADKSVLPPLLQGFGAVPPLISDIDLGEADLPDLAQQICDRRIDVLTVEELTDDAVAGLERAGITGLLPHQYLMPKPSGGGGTGIYSRFPLSDQQPLGFFAMANLSAKLEVGQGHTVTITAVHPMAPYPSPAWMWAWEMDRLRTAVHQRSEDGDPVIVSGDFNSTYSHSRYRAMLTDGFQDAADQVGAGDIRTYPADRAFPAVLGIDHVVTKQVLVHKLERITLPGSDHFGLFAVLAPHF